MTEDQSPSKDVTSATPAAGQPTKPQMTELMKAHLDLIEGGARFSSWLSKP